jgi:phage-related protein
MLMLGTAITRLVQKVGSLILTATEYLTKKLSQLLGVLTDLKTRFVALHNQLVPLVLKLKALLANLTTLVLSIKLVVTSVLVKIWELGSQLVTTVRQILQLVLTAFKKNKEPVDKTK